MINYFYMRALHSRRRRDSHSFAVHYPHTRFEALYGLIVFPLVVVGILFILQYIFHIGSLRFGTISLPDLALAAALSLGRIVAAFVLSLALAVPLAVAATHSPLAQKLLLPLFDILESVPVLAFFPVLVGVFISLGLTNVAAIFVIFLAMLWNIVFALIGGVGLIPRDILYAAEVFGVTGFSYFRRILIPALVPQMVVGSILAIAQGWNIIIVAEVIRTYLPPDSGASNLFGLGSILVNAAATGQASLFAAALCTVVIIIAIFNFVIWQPMLKYAQRFKFE